MSFDVAFWCYIEALDHDHSAVLASLESGSKVEGLALLDTGAMVSGISAYGSK